MTSFGWNKKIGGRVLKRAAATFAENTKIENDNDDEVDWISLLPKRANIASLEDAVTKSQRLKLEGEKLAETERYWEAIKKWDEAIQLTPKDAKLWEMKSQALLILCELFPALHTAEKVTQLDPQWWVGYQTLGRIQLGIGEVGLAIKSFSRALLINPANSELWTEDLQWACSLQEKKNSLVIDNENEKSEPVHQLKITELDSDLSNNSNDVGYDEAGAVSLDSVPRKSGKKIKTLPKNYVYMRDTL
ncbi:hypothetical protein ScPMuIL_001733 [Solemya velum]